MYQDQAEDKDRKEKAKNPEKFESPKESEMFLKNGDIRQCNEGRYAFRLIEH